MIIKRKMLYQNSSLNSSMENASEKFCPQIGDSITVPYQATDAIQRATLFAIIINCLMWPTGCVANCFVFITVLRKPQLRTVYNTSVLCLIAADLCVILLAQTSNIVYLVNKFTTGDYSCSLFFIYNLFTWLCHGLSFFTLLFISIERYFAVFHPFWYKESVTKTRIICAIVTTWVICGALVIILNFMPSIPHSVRTVVMTCLFLPSILSTVVIYLKIFREIRGNTAQVGPPVHGSPAETQVRKSSKTVGVIIGVQIMSFFPCICLNIVQMLSLVPSVLLIHGIFPFAEAAAFMNAVLDPMIYFWRNKEARGSLGELRHINICMKSKTDVSLSQTENSTVVIQLKDYGSG